MNKAFPSYVPLIALIIVSGVWLFKNFQISKWTSDEAKNRVISHDVKGYYAYLPALFVHGDLSLAFKDTSANINNQNWTHAGKAPSGEYVIKMSMGCAFLYLPFFLIAHVFSWLTAFPPDGFSMPYHFAIAMSTVFYGVLGLWLMIKILTPYFNKWIIGLTVLGIGIATNLHAYVTISSAMTHAYSFMLFNLYLLLSQKLLKNPGYKTGIILGLIGGLIILIRPTNAIPVTIIPLFLGVWSFGTIKERIGFFLKNYRLLLLIILAAFVSVLPQLIYWKWLTGDWLYFSYSEEGFFFDRFLWYEVLFSFRNGWLIYTPIMAFAIAGLFCLRGSLKKYLMPNILILIAMIYVFGAWWCWWFGGSFGYRSMIDFYGIFAIPMAACFSRIAQIPLAKWALLLVIGFFIHLNIYQTRQFRIAVLHWDSMTKEAYWEIFLNTNLPENYQELLQKPDYEKAMNGDPQAPRFQKKQK